MNASWTAENALAAIMFAIIDNRVSLNAGYDKGLRDLGYLHRLSQMWKWPLSGVTVIFTYVIFALYLRLS